MDHPYLEKQRQLIVQVKTMMARHNIDARRLSEILGLSYSHVVGILAGDRWLGGGDKSNVEKFAKFLGVPVLTILVWCNYITAQDCVVSHGVKESLALALRKLELDPSANVLVPSADDWNETPESVQLAFVMMYELYAKRTLLEHAHMELPENTFNKPIPKPE
jgi:hypothetical protein